VRLYDRLFLVPQPGTGERDFLEELNPESLQVTNGYVEQLLGKWNVMKQLQFERHGYFVVDWTHGAQGQLVLNRVVGLKDSWSK
jgi:glutaminyl-tRNA synthetase